MVASLVPVRVKRQRTCRDATGDADRAATTVSIDTFYEAEQDALIVRSHYTSVPAS